MNATVFKVQPLQGWISEGGFDPGLKLGVDLEKGLRPFSLYSSDTAPPHLSPQRERWRAAMASSEGFEQAFQNTLS